MSPDDSGFRSPTDQVSGTPLFDKPVTRMVRASDPATSKQAAVNASDFAAGHRKLIIEALSYYGPRGATMRHLESFTGLTGVQIARRMHELRPDHAVTFDGKQGAGHESPAIVIDGCSVHVLVEHRAACKAIHQGRAA